MKTRIRRYAVTAALALAAATMAFAQHLELGAGEERMAGQHLGKSQAHAIRVGDPVDDARLHTVSRPGLYGIGNAPAGSRYGVIDGALIRYDSDTMQILSVIRQVDFIPD